MMFNKINTCNSQYSTVTTYSQISKRDHLELQLKI